MPQPTKSVDLKRAGLAAILSLGMVLGPVPSIALADETSTETTTEDTTTEDATTEDSSTDTSTGSIENTVETVCDGDLEVSSSNLKDIALSLLTDSEKDEGLRETVWMRSTKLDPSSLNEDKVVKPLQAAAKEYDADGIIWFNLSLEKQYGTEAVTAVDEWLDKDVRFSVKVPKENWNTSPYITYTFYLFRCVDGTAAKLSSADDSGLGVSLDGPTAQNATYLIAYKKNLKEVNWADGANIWWGYSSDGKTLYLSDTQSSLHNNRWAIKTSDNSLADLRPDWLTNLNRTKVERVVIDTAENNILKPRDMRGWFKDCTSLKEIVNLDKINTSNVYNMSSLFEGCTALESLDLSGFDINTTGWTFKDSTTTYDCTNMNNMFEGCDSLVKVTLGKNFNFNYVLDDNGSAGDKKTRVTLPSATWTFTKLATGAVENVECRLGSQRDSHKLAWDWQSGYMAGQWMRTVELTVTFDPNAGSDTVEGTMESMSGLSINPFKIPANGYTYEGHTFQGWNTQADGTGTMYQPGDEEYFTGDTTLYAIWDDASALTITYKPNGPTADDKTSSISKDEGGTLLGTGTFTWEGHTLTGWNTAADGSGTSYTLGQTIAAGALTSDLTLYAVWDGATSSIRTYCTGTPSLSATNLDAVAAATLTADEIATGGEFYLQSTLLSGSSVDATEAKLLTAAATSRGATGGVYFDISLYKKIGSADPVKITQKLVPAVKFSVEVPSALRNSSSNVTRTFYLIRYHDGTATLMSMGTGNTLSAESDVFSTYLLAYKDETSGSNTNNSSSGSSTRSTTPNTGDASFVGAGAMGLAGFLAAGLGALRRRKD